MTKEEADRDSSIITCTPFILGSPAITLIDLGATHSFISESFTRALGIAPGYSYSMCNILLPSGEEIKVDTMIHAYPIQ